MHESMSAHTTTKLQIIERDLKIQVYFFDASSKSSPLTDISMISMCVQIISQLTKCNEFSESILYLACSLVPPVVGAHGMMMRERKLLFPFYVSYPGRVAQIHN